MSKPTHRRAASYKRRSSKAAPTLSAPYEKLFAAWSEFYVQVPPAHGGYRIRPPSMDLESSMRLSDLDRVANLCIERVWDVSDYVIVGVETLRASGVSPILPRDLMSAGVITAYVTLCATRRVPDTYTQMWLEQEVTVRQIIARAPSMGTDPRKILALSSVPLDPWFRVLYVDPDPTLYANYGIMCHAELRRNAALREFLRARIPERIRKLEDAFGQFGEQPPEVRV